MTTYAEVWKAGWFQVIRLTRNFLIGDYATATGNR
jgi:hypothetical protein